MNHLMFDPTVFFSTPLVGFVTIGLGIVVAIFATSLVGTFLIISSGK